MTNDEFDEKYKNYLTPGFYGCEIGDERVIDYLDKCFQKLITLPNFKYQQIKTKFGKARFYCDEVPSKLIDQIEDGINTILNE